MPRKTLAEFKVEHLQVLDENGAVDTKLEPDLSADDLLRLYRGMVRAREMDQRMLKLQRQGRIGTFGPCTGQEAPSTAAALAMQADDWFIGSFRELGGRLFRGEPLTNTLFFHNGWEEGNVLPDEVSRRMLPIAAEVICGRPAEFDNRAIPAVVYTDPEIAWSGLTEREAEAEGIAIGVGRFPLAALGRARTLDRIDGMVKIICDPENELILGMGIVGPHASELIAEGTLAIEMGATLEDLVATIHPHPTLSEAVMEAAEVAQGAAVHVNPPRRK